MDKIKELRAELECQRREAVAACKATGSNVLTWMHAGRALGIEAAIEAIDETLAPAVVVPEKPGPLDEFERKRLADLRHKSSMDELAGGVACTSVAQIEERWALEARERL